MNNLYHQKRRGCNWGSQLYTKAGQSLLEAVVGTALVTLVLTALVAAISYSLSSSQNSKQRALATKYAQEAVEWLRGERDTNWFDFYSRAGEASAAVYCLDTLDWVGNNGACGSSDYIPGTNLRRQISLLGNGIDLSAVPPRNQDRVDVTVTVSFPRGSQQSDVTVYTSLSKY